MLQRLRFGFGSALPVVVVVVLATSKLFVAGQSDCSFEADALTLALGRPTPRTCIDVPFDDGSGTTVMQSRCYYTYVPDNPVCSEKFDTDLTPVPVVFDVHGLGGCPLFTTAYTGWREQADKDCFVVVWPSGNNDVPGAVGTCFNLPGGLVSEKYGDNLPTAPCCCMNVFDAESSLNDPKPDDPLFLSMAIEQVIEDVGADPSHSASIDRSRVYMAGHSNGCITSLSMAALYPDAVAAVCCHAGSVVTPFDSLTSYANNPVPIWMVHGKKDDSINFDGVPFLPPFLTPGEQRGFWPVLDILDYLGEVNGCQESDSYDLVDGMVATEVDADADANANATDDFVELDDDATNANGVVGTVHRKTNCHKGADVRLVALADSKHVPYLLGDASIDTTAMAWEFCSSHTKSPPPQLLEGTAEGSSSSMEEVPVTATAPETPPESSSGAEPEPKPTPADGDSSPPADEDAGASAEESSGSVRRFRALGISILIVGLAATIL